jgi:Fe-S cluster assembly ATPase SufC
MEFLTLVKEKMKLLELKEDLLKRAVNVGFSGGEKKRNEIFQMAVLEPKLAVLDETDSGLDIDALKIVSHGVNKLKSPEQRDARHHALPAPARLHRARLRARAGDGRIVKSGFGHPVILGEPVYSTMELLVVSLMTGR